MRTVKFLLIYSIVFGCLMDSGVKAENRPVDEAFKPLKVVFIENSPPFSFVLPDGSATGLYVEFWQLWSKVNGIPIELHFSSLSSGISRLKSGEFDMHGGLFINAEREAWALFTSPIHKVDTGIFFHGNKKDSFSLSTPDIRVGVRNDSFQHSYVKRNYPNVQLVLFDNTEQIFMSLLDSKIDAVVGEIPSLDSQIAKMGLRGVFQLSDDIVLSNQVHGLVSKENEKLLPMINSGIEKISVDHLIALEEKWLPNMKPFFSLLNTLGSLTSKEKYFLKKHALLKLGVDKAGAPYEFVDSNGGLSGVSSEYIAHLSKKLNVKLQPNLNLTWSEALVALGQGKIDVMSSIARTDERAKSVLFTKPYVSTAIVIATRKGGLFIQDLDDLSGKKVGVRKNFFIEGKIRSDYPKINIVYTTSIRDGIEKIEAGEIDATVGSLIGINNILSNENHSNLIIAGFTPYRIELSMAVRKGLKPLVEILNKGISSVSAKQKSIIENNWLSIDVNIGTDIKVFVYWALPIVSLLLLIVFYVSRANRNMQFEIIERKKAEKELEILKNKAEAANQAKGDFLANMSHEFRTPMNAVVGMSHLLEESGLTSQQAYYNKTLHNSASSLLVLIDDILDLSKVEAGRLELESRPFKLADIVENVEDQVRLIVDNQVIDLITHIAPDVPTVLLGDSIRFGQILLNLVNNAAKFTEKGQIKISVETQAKSKENITLKISVLDTGIGMSREQQNRLFKTYSQGDSSITRKYGGTGLGLTISKKLSELMGGEIGMRSELGVGSLFHFTVVLDCPDEGRLLKIANDEKQQDDDYSSLLDKKILLVDDNQVNLIVAKTMLTNVGIDVSTATNGLIATEQLEKSEFDAVLMDIQMPVMDGYEATSHIRNELGLSQLPIIAVSANVMKQDIQKSIDSGMNAHIGKPINVRILMQTLIKHISKL